MLIKDVPGGHGRKRTAAEPQGRREVSGVPGRGWCCRARCLGQIAGIILRPAAPGIPPSPPPSARPCVLRGPQLAAGMRGE